VFTLPHVGLVRSLGSRASPEKRLDGGDNSRVAAAMKLISHCGSGRVCCRFVASLVEIAQLTGLSFARMLDVEEFELLDKLLRTGHGNRFSLAKDFVTIASISDQRLATFVSGVMLDSLRGHDDLFPAAGREQRETPVLRLPKRLCTVDTRKSSGSVDLIQMFDCADVLGYRLVELIKSVDAMMKDTSVKLLTVQVILLTYANDCFTIAASASGVAVVLAVVRRVVLKLFETQQYDMIVYLLASIGRYGDMNYVFDGLKQEGQFDLLFVNELQNEERYRLALIDFIHRFHPDDTVTQRRIAEHFGMHQELAKITELSAAVRLEKLGATKLASRGAAVPLKSALQEYVKAAELYAKAKCSFEVLSCMSKVRLLVLQSQLLKTSPPVRIVNLTDDEALGFVKSCQNFNDARIVQEAYRLSVVWADVVFEKAVKNGVIRYVDDMVSAKRLTNDILNSVVHRYLALRPTEVTSSARANMKRLLEYWTTVTDKYQAAKLLKFDDVVRQIESDEFLSSCVTE
jgi:spatacsin